MGTGTGMRDLRAILGRALLEEPLMQQALTHRSAARDHNERVEFLGDAVLGLLVSEFLYRRHPSFTEGELTRLRSHLVREKTLAEIAREIDLASLVVVGRGESKSGGRGRDALLADTFEAVVGALYLLRGVDQVAEFVTETFSGRLEEVPSPEALKDPKSRLQEYLQAQGGTLPRYELHEKAEGGGFRVVCRVETPDVEFSAEATSRREAEQQAAAGALERIRATRR